MLRLSGFELYSRWVPLIFIRVGMPKNFDWLKNESTTEVGDES